MIVDEKLNQLRCLYKDCSKSMPFRYHVYDGKISARCRFCKNVTVKWFLKGQELGATVLLASLLGGYEYDTRKNKEDVIVGGGSLPVSV